MRICVTSSGPTIEADLDPRFGRCAYFLFVDSETLEVEAAENSNAQQSGGAGILSAQLVVDRNAGAVVTGRVGPNAERVLRAAGVEVVTVAGGTAREAVEIFKSRAAGEPEATSMTRTDPPRAPVTATWAAEDSGLVSSPNQPGTTAARIATSTSNGGNISAIGTRPSGSERSAGNEKSSQFIKRSKASRSSCEAKRST